MLLAIQSHTHTIEILGCPLLCSFLHEPLDEPRQLCVVFGRKWPHFGTPLAVACPLHPLQCENGRTFYHCLTLERIHTRQKGLRFLGFFFFVCSQGALPDVEEHRWGQDWKQNCSKMDDDDNVRTVRLQVSCQLASSVATVCCTWPGMKTVSNVCHRAAVFKVRPLFRQNTFSSDTSYRWRCTKTRVGKTKANFDTRWNWLVMRKNHSWAGKAGRCKIRVRYQLLPSIRKSYK